MSSTDLPKTLLHFKVFESFSGHLMHWRHPSPSSLVKGRFYSFKKKEKKLTK